MEKLLLSGLVVVIFISYFIKKGFRKRSKKQPEVIIVATKITHKVDFFANIGSEKESWKRDIKQKIEEKISESNNGFVYSQRCIGVCIDIQHDPKTDYMQEIKGEYEDAGWEVDFEEAESLISGRKLLFINLK